ncbi:MAG: hypothetical protein KHX56_14235 [Clostridiales bacterium]|nr:hypothetical protein [Clostridiales bacterium]
MIIDINTELRDFTYITNVYKCIANYNLKGHQIGRKIGDMLEILTMGAVYQNPQLVERLSTEEKLEGYTTAGHKVEFGFFNTSCGVRRLFGAIECKCVGVEETVSGKNNRHLRKIRAHDAFSIDFSGRWQPVPITFLLSVKRFVGNDCVEVDISANSTPALHRSFVFTVGDNIKVVIDENNDCLVTTAHGNMLDEIPTIIRICKTIRLLNISDGTATFALFDCLTGPQTIEKAKQASFVAMDLRKKVDGYWGKEEVPAGQKHMTFVHVLCEFSHWEEKSRNVIKTCIDHNVIVPDAIIIKAFEVFEERFGGHMLDKISKREFENDQQVRQAVNDILAYYENRVFYDIEIKKYVRFNYANDSLAVIPVM